jgi:hypothetical protein
MQMATFCEDDVDPVVLSSFSSSLTLTFEFKSGWQVPNSAENILEFCSLERS